MTARKYSLYLLVLAFVVLLSTSCGDEPSDINKDWQIYDLNSSKISNDWIYCIAVDSKNNKWFGTIGTRGKGLSVLKR